MIKIIASITSFILGRYDLTFKKSMLLLTEQILIQSRKLFIFATVVSISSLLFISGILIFILQATNQYDTQGYIILTSGLISALFLIFIPLLSLIAIFNSSIWDKKFKEQISPSSERVEKKSSTSGLIEQTLSLLLLEFIKTKEKEKHSTQNEVSGNETSRHSGSTVISKDFADTIN